MSAHRKIRIAHSPDSDDAFMFYAMKAGHIGADKYDFEIERRDIEELNRAALNQEYDVTAISFHAFAHLADKYVLLASGASFAEKDWGPVLVSRERALGFGQVVAIPGEWTTAALLLKILLPDARTVVIPFEKILAAVLAGEVDAGLLIHEGQMEFAAQGLTCTLRLIDGWRGILRERGAAEDLPLPLGGNAVSKILDDETRRDLACLMRESVDWAMAHHAEARDYARQFKRGMTAEQADVYLSWYANERTLDMGAAGREALQILYQVAAEKSLIRAGVSADPI